MQDKAGRKYVAMMPGNGSVVLDCLEVTCTGPVTKLLYLKQSLLKSHQCRLRRKTSLDWNKDGEDLGKRRTRIGWGRIFKPRVQQKQGC